ncbi:MAG: PEP-CTERM sorting domain-containing protein [Hydrococcus sp. RM1_1_31]|nr:PEP-CTERM sorting domain-containing protein [Hydrococcus sp. RM1_1_31]
MMRKSNFYRKLGFCAINTVSLSILLNSTSTYAATVVNELKFFNTANVQVGSGEFSYDDAKPFEATFYDSLGLEMIFSIDANDNWFLLESLSVNVGNLSWNQASSYYQFWVPSQSEVVSLNSGSPRSVRFNDFGFPSKTEAWIVGDSEFLPYLLMDDSSNFFQFSREEGAPLTGTWTATQREQQSIPEPSTLLAILSVIGFSFFVRKASL